MNKKKKLVIVFTVLLVVLTCVFRLLKLVPNFMPLGALAIWCGLYIRSRWSVFVPLLVMVATDMIIGWHTLVFFTWGCMALYFFIGYFISHRRNITTVVVGTLTGSVLFFLITNFAVWVFTPMYARTWAGLSQCFYMALPFFRNTVIGDLFYVGAFIGVFEMAYALLAARRRKMVISQVV